MRLEDGRAIVTLQARGGPRPGLPRRERAAAAQDRPEGHGRRAHARARRRPASCRRASGSRSARRCPTSTSTRSSPRSTATRARTCVLLLSGGARGPARQRRASWRTRSAASSRLARDSRKVAEQLATRRENIQRVIHNFSLLVRGARRQGRPARASSSRTPTPSSPSLADQDANLRATLQELPSALDATTRRRSASADALAPRARPDAGGAAARPPARSGRRCAQTRPFLRDDDADHPRRDPAVRARGAPAGARAAPGDARPRRRDARPRRHVPASSTRCSTRSPTTRRASARRATCSGPRGSTTSARRCSPTRTRTARSAAASSWSAASSAADRSRASSSATRSSACSPSCSRRRPTSRSARRTPRADRAGGAG